MTQLLVWGAGGHGRVVADLAEATGFTIAGFIDRELDPGRQPWPICLADARLRAALGGGESIFFDGRIALGIGDNNARLACADLLGSRCAPALVHPRASVTSRVSMGEGTVVFAGAVINIGACLGRAVIVNSNAVVEHDCVLDDGAHVSPGAILAGGVRVGTRSWLGAGAVVIQGVRIGSNVIVGAGAVVLRDVPDGVTIVGVPARITERKY